MKNFLKNNIVAITDTLIRLIIVYTLFALFFIRVQRKS